MPSLVAGSARVHVQALQLVVIHDLQDMRMTADEKPRGVSDQLFFHRRIIAGRITADVCHIDFHFFRCPPEFLRIEAPDILSVDVAIDAPQGFEVRQALGQLSGAEISGMPYFIAGPEMTEDVVVQKMMGIRYEADA